MKTRLPFAIAALVVLAACVAKEEPAAATRDVLAGVPILDGSRLVERSGTAEATRVAYLVRVPPAVVAAIYRRFSQDKGWRIVGDVTDQGGTDLYVERQGPPLWIQIRPEGEWGTRYSLIGALGGAAANDSAAGGDRRPPAPAGSAR